MSSWACCRQEESPTKGGRVCCCIFYVEAWTQSHWRRPPAEVTLSKTSLARARAWLAQRLLIRSMSRLKRCLPSHGRAYSLASSPLRGQLSPSTVSMALCATLPMVRCRVFRPKRRQWLAPRRHSGAVVNRVPGTRAALLWKPLSVVAEGLEGVLEEDRP